MEYTIQGIQQTGLIELGLDLVDGVILSWVLDFYNSGKMNTWENEGKEYFWVSYASVIEAFPTCGIKSNKGMAKRFDKYEACGLMESKTRKQGGSFSYFRFTEKLQLLLNRVDTPVAKGGNASSQGVDTPVADKDSLTIKPSTKSSSPKQKNDFSPEQKELLSVFNEQKCLFFSALKSGNASLLGLDDYSFSVLEEEVSASSSVWEEWDKYSPSLKELKSFSSSGLDASVFSVLASYIAREIAFERFSGSNGMMVPRLGLFLSARKNGLVDFYEEIEQEKEEIEKYKQLEVVAVPSVEKIVDMTQEEMLEDFIADIEPDTYIEEDEAAERELTEEELDAFILEAV